jgi:hypothetical protein
LPLIGSGRAGFGSLLKGIPAWKPAAEHKAVRGVFPPIELACPVSTILAVSEGPGDEAATAATLATTTNGPAACRLPMREVREA